MSRLMDYLSKVLRQETIYTDFIAIKPVPKERARNNFHTPARTREFETFIGLRAAKVMSSLNRKMCIAPVKVELAFHVPYPKKFNDAYRFLSSDGLIYPLKGDIDNLAKSVLDGMNNVVYKDDKQVAHLDVRRSYEMAQGVYIKVTKIGLSKSEAEYAAHLKQTEETTNDKTNRGGA